MSKLVKLKLASKKSLACFLPSRMASPGTSTLFPSPEPEAPDDGPKSEHGSKPRAVEHGSKPKGVEETKTSAGAAPPPQPAENLGREIVSYGLESKKEEKKEEPEEILELKTPGFIRVFGCDNCEDSDTDIRHHTHHDSSSEASEDDDSPHASGSHHPQPSHLIPVVHLRVPMKNEDDVRKVVAALQIKGVLEVACDLENQIVKVSGNVDPDRLLKKVKKVKRKSRLISYSNPSEMPIPPERRFHSDIPPPPPPAYGIHQPVYEERFRPPSQPHIFSRDFNVPPPHVRPNLRPAAAQPRHYDNKSHGSFTPNLRPAAAQPRHYDNESHGSFTPNLRPAAAQPRHYDNEAFCHHQHPPLNVRPPPPATFYRDDSFFPDYIPSNLRPPSSPPHYSSNSRFYPERSPPSLRRSTSPPRRRSYHHDPHFRPPPPVHYPGGPPSRVPWRPGAPYSMDDFQQVPDRMMHMYH